MLLLCQCEQPEIFVKVDKDTYTEEDQVNIGRTMKEQLLKMPDEFPILDKRLNECAYERVEILFLALLKTPVVQKRSIFDWSVHIIDSEERNAFILPGGHLFIYTGLLKYLQSESELVAILGNEIAYADQEYTLNALRGIYENTTISEICAGNIPPEMSEILLNLPYIEYSEENILSSDSISVSLVCPFQYNANSLKHLVEKAHTTRIEWIDSKDYDNIDKRLDYIKKLTADCGTDEPTFEKRYKNYLASCIR